MFWLYLLSFLGFILWARWAQILHDAAAHAGTLQTQPGHVRQAHSILLSGVVIFAALGYWGVSNWWEDLGRERAAEEAAKKRKEQATDAERQKQEAAAERERDAEKRRQAEEAARTRSARVAELRAWPAPKRLIALRKCFGRDSDCDDSPELLLEAAASDRERTTLENVRSRFERAERLANRSLICRDGTMSPSCTCGGPRRGCCSHHGGVKGCAPLEE